MTAKPPYKTVEPARCRFLALVKFLMEHASYILTAVIALLFYIAVLPHFRPYAWVDDWIYTKPLGFTTLSEWWRWLWQQHVDHRIPIQKLTNFLVLSWTGFDYRWLVAINFAMAIATSILLLEVARRYRGRRSIGDTSIPLILLNFGMGYTQWGFQFQFMSSILSMSIFLFSALIWLQTQKNMPALIGALSLMVACLTGMNGVLPALGIGIACIAWAIWRHKPTNIVFLFAAPIGMALVILAMWTPFVGSDQSPIKSSELLNYAAGLTTGAFTIFVQHHEAAARIIIFVLLFLAAASILIRIGRKILDDADLLLTAFLGVYLCLLASIAYGRVKVQGGWEYGSAIHYGVLAIFIPILAWVIASKALPKLRAEILGLAVLIVALFVFEVNYQWRAWMIGYCDPLQAKALQDLKSNKSIDQIATDNITQFHVGLSGIKEVTDGISALRKAGYELYGGKRHR